MNATDSTENVRVLTVKVGSPEDAFDELGERFVALDRGDEPDELHEVILRSEADLNRLLSPTNVRLLRTIAREEPRSIRETARLVDRDVHQVHDNLTELARLNLVRFVEDGRAKRPVVWYDEIDVEVPIGSDDRSSAPA